MLKEIRMLAVIQKELQKDLLKALGAPEEFLEPSEEPSGETIVWRGETWEVPSDAQIQAWFMDSRCETPDGRTVEPDHEDSWLSVLGI